MQVITKELFKERACWLLKAARKKWWALALSLAVPTLLMWMVAPHYKLGLNLDKSLDCRLFFIEKGVMPVKGECMAFRCKDLRPYFREGIIFIKWLVGVPGDRIDLGKDANDFYINGKFAARARDADRKGRPLKPAEFKDQHLCPTCYFVLGDHPRSYDSRYWGYVTKDQVMGKATCLF